MPQHGFGAVNEVVAASFANRLASLFQQIPVCLGSQHTATLLFCLDYLVFQGSPTLILT